jgi:hypothetical protein
MISTDSGEVYINSDYKTKIDSDEEIMIGDDDSNNYIEVNHQENFTEIHSSNVKLVGNININGNFPLYYLHFQLDRSSSQTDPKILPRDTRIYYSNSSWRNSSSSTIANELHEFTFFSEAAGSWSIMYMDNDPSTNFVIDHSYEFKTCQPVLIKYYDGTTSTSSNKIDVIFLAIRIK